VGSAVWRSATNSGLLNTHDAIVEFGKYSGKRLTRIPVGYLKWAVGVGAGGNVRLKDGTMVKMFEAAKAEMERRGERLENVDISGHAIDRISQHHLEFWKEMRKPDEGMYSWAQRMVLELLDHVRKEDGTYADVDDGKIVVDGGAVKWVIQVDLEIPALITVK